MKDHKPEVKYGKGLRGRKKVPLYSKMEWLQIKARNGYHLTHGEKYSFLGMK